ncbi:MAG: DMT family transporter [Alphaproteobacteria bacterium]|nr:DMT family transporter [Alphaproteobacteria bacterium]
MSSADVSALVAAKQRTLGIAFVLLGSVCFSVVGVIVRLLDAATVWQAVFYRGVAFTVCITAFIALRHRGRFVAAFAAIGVYGVVGALGLAWGTICYLWAFYHTTVANAVFFFGVLPLATGFVAWLLFRERVHQASWAAMVVALLGIVVMFYGGFVMGGWVGNLLALAGIVGYTALTIAARAGRAVDMMPMLALGAALSSVIALVIEGGIDPIGFNDLLRCLAIGGVVSVGFALFTVGARYVRAGELSLISNFELILGPLLVWIVVAEVPSLYTFAGGGIVVAAVLAQGFLTARQTGD